MLAKAGINGELATRANASAHHGDYRVIVEGVNNCLDAVVGPLNEAARLLLPMQMVILVKGLQLMQSGDFRQLSNTIDGFGDTLQGVINDSCDVLNSMADNDLTRRVKVRGIGDFVQLTDGVENCRIALNEMVDLMIRNAECISSTAQGNVIFK
ncbi:MAG: hypothetical protein R2741_11365 [Methanolobus sp.]